MFETLPQDIPYRFRKLLKSPVFTLIAVLSLGLGIGLNVIVFTWIKAILLQPLPRVKEASQLVQVYSTDSKGNPATFSYPNYIDSRDQNEVFSGLIAYD